MSRAKARGAGRSVLGAPVAAATRLVQQARDRLHHLLRRPAGEREPPDERERPDEPEVVVPPEGGVAPSRPAAPSGILTPLGVTGTGRRRYQAIVPLPGTDLRPEPGSGEGDGDGDGGGNGDGDGRAGEAEARRSDTGESAARERGRQARGPEGARRWRGGEERRGGEGDGEEGLPTRSLWRWLAGMVAAIVTAIVTSLVLGWVQQVPVLRPPPRGPTAGNSTSLPVPLAPGEAANPLTVAVAQWRDSGCGVPDWIFLGDASEIDFQPGADPRDPWAGNPALENAVVASPSHVEATVQGRTGTAVVLTGVEAQVHRRRPVPVGTVLTNTMCGQLGPSRSFEVDLDREPPAITSRGERDRRTGQPLMPVRFPYVVSSSDPETFLISAVTERCDCEWTVELSWRSAGRTGTVVIDDDGRPFRTVSPQRSRTICFPDGTCNPYVPGPGRAKGYRGGGR